MSGSSRGLVDQGRVNDAVRLPISNGPIRLLGQEVFPQVRDWAKELGLKSPFEAETPVSVDYAKDLKRPVAAAE